MKDMTGSQGAGRQGLHMADNGKGTNYQGDTAGAGALTGVREGIGKRVNGGAPPNPARRGKRGFGAGGQRGRRGQKAQDFQDKDLPSRRV